FDGVNDSTQTAHQLAFAGHIERQTRRTVAAHHSRFLHALDFAARVFNPFEFIDRGRCRVSGGEFRVQAAQPAPLAQVAFGIVCAQGAGVLQCEFQRHRTEYRSYKSYRTYCDKLSAFPQSCRIGRSCPWQSVRNSWKYSRVQLAKLKSNSSQTAARLSASNASAFIRFATISP